MLASYGGPAVVFGAPVITPPGWRWIGRKEHFIDSGRALCGRVLDRQTTDTETTSHGKAYECKSCRARLDAKENR